MPPVQTLQGRKTKPRGLHKASASSSCLPQREAGTGRYPLKSHLGEGYGCKGKALAHSCEDAVQFIERSI